MAINTQSACARTATFRAERLLSRRSGSRRIPVPRVARSVTFSASARVFYSRIEGSEDCFERKFLRWHAMCIETFHAQNQLTQARSYPAHCFASPRDRKSVV